MNEFSAGFGKWIQINIDSVSASIDLNFSSLEIFKKQEAIDYTVDKITKTYDNLYVCLSGGIDSEFVAESLLIRGVKFTPLIVNVENCKLENWYAHYWCYKNKITPRIINLPWNYVVKTFPSIIKKMPGASFISAIDYFCHLEVAKDNGKLLSGTAEPFDRTPGNIDVLSLATSFDLDINSFDFNLNYLGDHPNSFISYTPSLFFSIINELDYNKPAQIAMAEYYGVLPRPKISFLDLTNPLVKLNNYSFNFFIGNKDIFLERCLARENINVKGELILP